MTRKKDTITLSVPPGTKDKLEAIARHHDIYWGKNPSVSGLLGAIAQGELSVGSPFTLNASQIDALRQAIDNLIDAGHAEHAQTVMALLLDRGQLETPFRREILQKVNPNIENLRVRLNQFIEQKQSFLIVYRNSQHQVLEFTVRFAAFKLYEKRVYLQIWCNETEDSNDIAELKHYRCLRLDRIRIQSLLAIDEPWREGFDSVEVQIHLHGWLIAAYESKPEDIEVEQREGYLWVKRRVINTFWFFRAIAKYYEDCEIVAPESVRQLHQQKIARLQQRYSSSELRST